MTFYRISILLFFILSGCGTSNNRKTKKFINEVDELFNDWHVEEPGGAIAIVQDGQVIYEKYYGKANLDKNEVFSERTLTDIGSISKQFTAVLITLLEEENRLSIEDDIRKYLPELPIYQNTIKIKHLLLHTSGIKDYEALLLLKGEHYFDEHVNNRYILDLISKQKTLNFKTNSKFEYSNSNYILLAEIIERITKKTLNEFAKEKVFDPLDMKYSAYQINQGEDFKNKAIGYVPTKTGFERPLYKSHLVGDGGIFTSLQDMIKWDLNFSKNKLGKANSSLLKRMQYREPLSDGTPNSMAFAQIYTQHPFGENSWSHGGSGGGYRSFYIRFEAKRLSIIVLCNSENNSSFEIANSITNLFFEYDQNKSNNTDNTIAKKETDVSFLSPNKSTVEHFTGYYYDEDWLSVLRIEFDDFSKQFVVNWLENKDDGYISLPINKTVIAEIEDSQYQYELDIDNQKLVHKVNGQLERSWKKLGVAQVPIDKFAGNYFADEIQHPIALGIVEEKLFSDNNFFSTLTRIGNTTFFDKKTSAVISFTINSENDSVAFSINIPRGDRSLRNLCFRKVN